MFGIDLLLLYSLENASQENLILGGKDRILLRHLCHPI